MAMIIVSGKEIFKQEKNESFQQFYDRVLLWELSQPEGSQPQKPEICACGYLKALCTKNCKSKISQSEDCPNKDSM